VNAFAAELAAALLGEDGEDPGVIGIVVSDAGGRIVEANNTFAALLGTTREELLAGVSLADLTPPEWSAADEVAARQIRTAGAARPYEKEFLRQDGGRVPILIGRAMLQGGRTVVFALDNSARRDLEQTRRDAQELEMQNRRIQELNRLKNEFLANLSHELRTPLNAIIGFSELLRDGEAGPLEEHQREFAGTILTSGKNLLRLLNDVLDLVRVEAGKLQLRPETVDLGAVFHDVTDIVRASAAAKRIDIRTEVDPVLAEGIFLDPARLKQIVYGFVSNAIKFTPEGGSVVLRAIPEGEAELRLEVEDTGPGIEPEVLQKLFLDPRPQHGGAGLGLVLTRRLSEAQGGKVEVRRAPGRGSVFAALLPRVAPAPREEEPRRAAVTGTSVLVIDDDPTDQVMLVEALAHAGYSAQVAGRGSEALALCRERRFDAITLDLVLPDMSGISLLAQIRKTPLNRETPVLVVSVAADSAVGFAVSDVLPKPASAQALLASLEAAGVKPGQPGEIMVVDDDADSLQLMTIALEKLGYRANCFQDGEAGLRAAEEAPPSAVVLDLLMPGIDGFQFLERLRASPATHRTPVLVWTTKDLSREELAHLERSAQGVVPKGSEGLQTLLDDLRRFTRS
jgi:PAS domain S-box-containing protein